MSQAQYIMVGGFLGAGKTTALLRLAELFRDEGKKVGLITNDQSFGLVDTAMLASHDFPVEEITGGCFCCRFNSLTDAAEKLSSTERPDVFLAEPVGSCTDLTATVSYPLRRMYGDEFQIAPFSVLVDPVRAERILGLAEGKSFSPKVIYIYMKQLEEADIILVNKTDLLDAERLTTLVQMLQTRFPQARVITAAARHGLGIAEWKENITTMPASQGESMEIDYDTYAEGESLLGWVNATVSLSGTNWDGNNFLAAYLAEVQARLSAGGIEIAHLKMTLSPREGHDLGVMNLVRTESQGELSHALQEPLDSGELIVNLRAEADPEVLKNVAVETLEDVGQQYGIQSTVQHVEAFRPGRPVPTHRDIRG